MNLAILHYHLNRGGVTRVIENQVAALDTALEPGDSWRVALIYGGRREGWSEDLPDRLQSIQLSLHEVPSLDYDGGSRPTALYEELARRLKQIDFLPEQTILHTHNHALGKNVFLPNCLKQLSADGYPLLLQLHDFPEDFRPANYRHLCDGLDRQADLAAALYPQASHIHYAVLNGRDRRILQAAGMDSERLHRLPNPVPKMSHLPARPQARQRLLERFGIGAHQRFILYPVRCIRRKNVGEALLYAALAPPDTVLGLTLPPLNPLEVPVYEDWKRLAAELELPCRFEVGAPGALSFAENLAAADLILTTSLAEGFGMVFLEAWLAGRPLIGRDLPEITCDFTDLGIRFDWLKPQLRVPLDWVGIETFRQTILEAYRRTLQAYDREEPADLAEKLDAKTDARLVDFGDLDERLQRQVLRIVRSSDQQRRRVVQLNAWVETALSIRREDVSAAIQQNAQAVGRHFSRVPSGRRLLDLYRLLAGGPRDRQAEGLVDGRQVFDEFLDFARFRPIRS